VARTVKPPTLAQWGCPHHWRVRHTRQLPGVWPAKHRNYRCEWCHLGMVTEEQPTIRWEAGDLVALVQALLPEGTPVYLRDYGVTELPLGRLNAILAAHGWEIHATRGRHPKKLVACLDEEGRRELYGRFELRHTPPHASGRKQGKRPKGRAASTRPRGA
jgi:hypothetical protein